MVFLHLSGAAVVTLLAILTAASSWSRRFIPSDRLLREDTSSELALCIWSTCIVGLVIVQGMLGAGAWVVSWGVPTGFFFEWMQWNLTEATVARSPTGAAVVTAHVVIGMMILGASVVMAILAGTRAGWCRGGRGMNSLEHVHPGIDSRESVRASAILAEARTFSLAGDLAMLTRPKITLMVLATVATTIWLTAGNTFDSTNMMWLLVGTALVAASSSIVNQILERASDRLMPRTAQRPLAAGRMSMAAASTLAAVSLLSGLFMIVSAGGWYSATAASLTWLLYVVLYTPLKRVSSINTAVGAIAGALPVAIGWLAADGPQRIAGGDSSGALAVAALATVLYLWQFPHFMAIAWLYRHQYASAGLRMLVVEDPSGIRAAGQSLSAAIAMVPASLILAVPSESLRLFATAVIASAAYLAAAIRFAVRRDDASARTLLLTSLGVLLALLLAAMLFGSPHPFLG